MTKSLPRLAVLLALAFVAATPALAQDDPAPEEAAAEGAAFDISVTATIVSDYRFRGVSSSDRDPAVQGSVDFAWNGFYAGLWMSSIARTADTDVEADLYAGYAGEAGPFEYEVGAIAYLYPGGDGTGNIYESTAALSYTFGPATARLEANYAPDQENLDGDNFYVSAGARVGIPTTPVTVFASAGRERGSFYGAKFDWSIGAEFTRGPFTASLGYHDTDLDPVDSGLGRDVQGGIVASASVSF